MTWRRKVGDRADYGRTEGMKMELLDFMTQRTSELSQKRTFELSYYKRKCR